MAKLVFVWITGIIFWVFLFLKSKEKNRYRDVLLFSFLINLSKMAFVLAGVLWSIF